MARRRRKPAKAKKRTQTDPDRTGQGKLPRLRALAIVALLTEPSHYAAAARLGISRSTLQVWLNDPEFAGELEAARREIVQGTVNALQVASRVAVKGLVRQVHHSSESAAYRAAIAILEHAHKATELTDVIERLKRIERGNGNAAGGPQAN